MKLRTENKNVNWFTELGGFVLYEWLLGGGGFDYSFLCFSTIPKSTINNPFHWRLEKT